MNFSLTFCAEIVASLLSSSPHPLFPRFLDLLVVTALPLLPPGTAASELHLLASALWPIYTAFLPPHAEQIHLGRAQGDRGVSAPPLQITLKLLTDLKAQIALPLQAAIESLLTRQVGRSEFTAALQPRAGIATRGIPKAPTMQLPELGKYLVVAAYCGSYNPAKSDLRLFGRGVGSDARKKKGGGTRRAGYGRVRAGKVSRRRIAWCLCLRRAGHAEVARPKAVPARQAACAVRGIVRRTCRTAAGASTVARGRIR